MSSGFAASGAMLRWMVCGNLLRPCWGSWSMQSLRAMNGSVVVIQPRAVFDIWGLIIPKPIQRPVIGIVAWSNVNVCSGHLMALLSWWFLEQMQMEKDSSSLAGLATRNLTMLWWTYSPHKMDLGGGGGCFLQRGGSHRGKEVKTERLGGEHNRAHDVKFPNN